MRQDELEKMLKQVLKMKTEAQLSQPPGQDCLSSEQLDALTSGVLPESQRFAAIKHLCECAYCRMDLQFHFDLMEVEEKRAVWAKLNKLKSLIPKLAGKLELLDFRDFGKKVYELSDKILKDFPATDVGMFIDQILNAVEARFSDLAVQVRGKADQVEETKEIDAENLTKAAQNLQDDVKDKMALLAIEIERQHNLWAGAPELWLFGHLTEPMRQRATCIRDLCEKKLELISMQGPMRYFPLLGIGHSKRILHYAVDLIKAFEDYFCSPLAHYAVYVGAYCYDLGMLGNPGEKELYKIYKDHGEQTYGFIMGKSKLGIPPSWSLLGFSNQQEALIIAELCCNYQKTPKGDAIELPKTTSIFVDGETMTIPIRALGAILRLANILDCGEIRLPKEKFLKTGSSRLELLDEYLKHELVDNVNIDKTGTIQIKMRKRYIYPAGFDIKIHGVQKQLEEDIKKIQEVLKHCGMILPDPEFDIVESMFLEPHLYLSNTKQQ